MGRELLELLVNHRNQTRACYFGSKRTQSPPTPTSSTSSSQPPRNGTPWLAIRPSSIGDKVIRIESFPPSTCVVYDYVGSTKTTEVTKKEISRKRQENATIQRIVHLSRSTPVSLATLFFVFSLSFLC